MASSVGGDLTELATLHKTLKTQSDAAQDLKSAIESQLGTTTWTGANSDRFRQAWEEFKPAFDKLQQELTTASDDVRKQHNSLSAAVGESAQI